MKKIVMTASVISMLIGSSAFAMSRIGEMEEAWKAPLMVAI